MTSPIVRPSRRQLIRYVGTATVAAVGCAGSSQRTDPPKEQTEEEVSPNEDLMREHGVLRRILLIYDEAIVRLEGTGEVPPDVLTASAGIVRKFIEDYHEKLEEEFVFPRMQRAGRLVDLVTILRTQHQAGRVVTDHITRLANASTMAAPESRRELAGALHAFNRMYRPHAAREDTVLFPAFRGVVSKHEYAELGEQFEAREHQMFGKQGFAGMVDAVAKLERDLGIYDLATFTPRT